MKWTLIALSVLGSLTYAVIFVVQAHHENRDVAHAAVADDRPVEGVVVDPADAFPSDPPLVPDSTEVATLPEGRVSEFSNATPPSPRSVGEAWPAGVSAFEAGDFETAAAALEVAVEENETAPYRHYLLGLTYRRLGEFDAAVLELQRSLELAPASVRTRVNLGRAHLDRGETEEARTVIDRALEIDLEHADTWHVLGRIELAEGNLEESVAAFTKATDRDATHAWAWNNRGYAHIQLEQFDAAIEPARRALEIDAEQAVFFNNLGAALERTGRDALAALAYGKAVLLGHGPAEVSHARVAEILIARGDDAPGIDAAESIDAAALIARIDDVNDVDVALDDAIESATVGEFSEFESNR